LVTQSSATPSPALPALALTSQSISPLPLALSFHCAALVLLSASLAGLSRGAYPLSSLQHPDSPSLHLPHLLRGALPLRAHNKRSPPRNLLPGERERYTSLQPRSASSRSALRHASYTPHVRLMYAPRSPKGPPSEHDDFW